jgi:hypothetical protein
LPIKKVTVIARDETILIVLPCNNQIEYQNLMAKLHKVGTVLILNCWLNQVEKNGKILLGVKIKESFNENTLTLINSNVIIYLIKPKIKARKFLI